MSDVDFATFLGLCIILALLLGAGFLCYVAMIVVPFVRDRPSPAGDPSAFSWHFVVPCRDEESVISGTLAYLTRTFPTAHVWVVDDDSHDRTAAVIGEYADRNERVHLIRRRLPDARTGKAHALNRAYRDICAWLPPGTDRTRAVLAVVDADGRPSAGLLAVCAGAELYGDPQVGAVQVEVRMSNRADPAPVLGGSRLRQGAARLFVRMQDLEFRGPISAIQMSRRHSRTVNVGGNGQLTRLSALDSIAGADGPWKGSLLEDFELGLHLLVAGWRNVYTTQAWVDQEALFHLRRFLTQRTRWCQGTMQCLHYLPRVWLSRNVTNLGALEVTYFLLQPWLQLAGSVVYPVPMLVMAYNAVHHPDFTLRYLSDGGWALITVYLIVGIGEFGIWPWLYRRRCEPSVRRRQAFGWMFAFTTYQLLVFVIAWRSLARVVGRRSGWAKTRRNAEPGNRQHPSSSATSPHL
ncbi:glycosyltransferase [Streptomyces sp. SPB4]|uniref:glycosyltransferase family 2 protein n=1 Tax=Streptomyces TaxID=1883 RepID=UPI0024762205|nr:glycosyltransferase [Streptomyces sp. SPB4]MDH6544040.1 1,2-diacylglycerol 3-beta-glucosyltransferase [Streptomyces sp. SPB4]